MDRTASARLVFGEEHEKTAAPHHTPRLGVND